MTPMNPPPDDYQAKLEQEGAIWGAEAERQAATTPPDWRYHRALRHNRVLHAHEIDALLDRITPNMRALELGCASGWLTLALAQRGAHVEGLDISEPALAIARAYYEQVKAETSGTVRYRTADLNALELSANTYDVIVVKGTLHHLIDLPHVITALHSALKPGGLLWISDSLGDEHPRTALAAAACMFVLPTHVSYGEKVRGLLKFGTRSAERIKLSMQAEGLSPFEGAGRGDGADHDWLALVQQHFAIEILRRAPAFTGYIAHQVNLPDALALPLLIALRGFDSFLVRLRVLTSSGVIVYARKA